MISLQAKKHTHKHISIQNSTQEKSERLLINKIFKMGFI